MSRASSAPDNWRSAHLSCPEEIFPLLEVVTAEMASAGYSEQDVFGVRLALEEALVNALKHGHRYDPLKKATLRYRIDQVQAVLEVEDQGPGFNPSAVPDPTAEENLERPTGRGLLLMRAYLTWVRFNDRGNCVTLCKCPSTPSAPPERPGRGRR